MKKVITILFLIISFNGFSQQSDFWENVKFGGGFGISFGSTTAISISPSAVYDFDNGFLLGAGVNYLHSSFNGVKTNVYGASIISLYQIPNINIQLSGELEQLFANQTHRNNTINYNYPALYLGAAFNKGRFAFGLRYDVLFDNNKSIFASPISPIIRIYF